MKMKQGKLEDAIALAVLAHRGQKDKAGHPYITHPLRVMFRCHTEVERIVAVLHDVVEDCGISFAFLRKKGFSEEVLAALDCVTERDGESYMAFVRRAARNPVAKAVKIADIEDNLDVRRLERVRTKDAVRLNKYLRALRALRPS